MTRKRYNIDELKEILLRVKRGLFDLRGIPADLNGCVLSGMNLSGLDFSLISMMNADLKNSDFTDANMIGVNLRGANLRHANLRCAILMGAKLIDADLSFVNLSGADLCGASVPADLCAVPTSLESQYPQVHARLIDLLLKRSNAVKERTQKELVVLLEFARVRNNLSEVARVYRTSPRKIIYHRDMLERDLDTILTQDVPNVFNNQIELSDVGEALVTWVYLNRECLPENWLFRACEYLPPAAGGVLQYRLPDDM